MYSKDELSAKTMPELREIASSLQLNPSPQETTENIIYAILDKQADDEGNKNPLGPAKRKRERIAHKDPKRVFSARGRRGESKDAKPKTENASLPLFKDIPAPTEPEPTAPEQKKPDEDIASQIKSLQEQLAAIPRHRGPKTKEERTLLAEIEKLQQGMENTPTNIENQETAEDVANTQPEVQEDKPVTPNADIAAMLQEKLNAQNKKQEQEEPAPGKVNEPSPDTVWDGDPGDGTDFITVVDVPADNDYDMPNDDYQPYDEPAEKYQMPNEGTERKPVNSPDNAENSKPYDFGDSISAIGVLEIMTDGSGFLRSSDYNYLTSPDDIYVTANQVKRNGLKTGDVVQCRVKPPREGDRFFLMGAIDTVNGRPLAEIRDRIPFENLTPLFPDQKYTLVGDPATTNISTRIVDLFSPIGKGQRALIVAQPKTGKTILMKNIANAIAANHPEAYLMMLLIDERPEEVTDMARTVNAEVIASTFDEPADRHVKIAGLVLEKAKRMVECGHDVVIFLDSITRLARAYNTVAPASGKVLTGGVDANALQKPKRFFGAARNIEGGGSLTIVATALIDTGSKMDEVIFEEFKGTGNMELQLDRTLSNKRIFPAVNLVASSTRRDDLLQDKFTLEKMWILRKAIAGMSPLEAMQTVHDIMAKTKTNEEFLMAMNG